MTRTNTPTQETDLGINEVVIALFTAAVIAVAGVLSLAQFGVAFI